jgi:hypothetical protein
MMIVFEELLDQLADEAKEAPGWVLVLIACALLPLNWLLPGGERIPEVLAAQHDESTVVGLIGLTLFLVGDALDTLIFPRTREKKRAQKLRRSALLLLGGWGVFLVLLVLPRTPAIPLKDWLPALVVGLGFLIVLRLPIKPSPLEQDTGWKWLHCGLTKCLDDARQSITKNLGIDVGMYGISKELLRSAEQYRGWVMIDNELAKFFRTAVIPLLVWCVYEAYNGEWRYVGAAAAAALIACLLYGFLKTLHMCLLYQRVAGFPEVRPLSPDVGVFLLKHGNTYHVAGAARVLPGIPEGLRVFQASVAVTGDSKPKQEQRETIRAGE